MAVPTTIKVQGSMLKITVSASLTELPGVENLEIDLGENLTYDNADISSNYLAKVFSGLRGGGKVTADLIRDPTNATQIALQIAYNSGATLASSVVIGTAGTTIVLSLLPTKLPASGKRGEGWMGKVEFEILTKTDWNAV